MSAVASTQRPAAKIGKRALLAACIADVMAAPDVEAVELAFQAGLTKLEATYGSYFDDRYRRASEKLRWDGANVRGRQLAETVEVGRFLPRFEARRRITIDGETRSVGYGGNSTGERYVWTYAEEWAAEVLADRGIPPEVIRETLQCWGWPHRALRALIKWDRQRPAADAVAQ